MSETKNGAVTVLLGAQWGDEGKGKIIDYLIEKYNVSSNCVKIIYSEEKHGIILCAHILILKTRMCSNDKNDSESTFHDLLEE